MNALATRISEWKQLLSVPSYRVRLFVFVLLGAFTFVVGVLLEKYKYPSLHDVAFDFGVTFVAVGLVSILWDFLGGDPIERRIADHISALDVHLDNVHRSLAASTDLLALGIERVWAKRSDWEKDETNGLAAWKKRLCEENEVSIISITFWNWIRDESFRASFFQSLDHKKAADIVLYHPTSEVAQARAADEADPYQQLPNEIVSTLLKLAEERVVRPATTHGKLRIGLTTRHSHFAQIIRAGERILVASYLSGKTGAPSPTMQLRGPNTPYFSTYLEQIQIVLSRAQQLDDRDFADILHKSRP
jgi:hypothetical protein